MWLFHIVKKVPKIKNLSGSLSSSKRFVNSEGKIGNVKEFFESKIQHFMNGFEASAFSLALVPFSILHRLLLP